MVIVGRNISPCKFNVLLFGIGPPPMMMMMGGPPPPPPPGPMAPPIPPPPVQPHGMGRLPSCNDDTVCYKLIVHVDVTDLIQQSMLFSST